MSQGTNGRGCGSRANVQLTDAQDKNGQTGNEQEDCTYTAYSERKP